MDHQDNKVLQTKNNQSNQKMKEMKLISKWIPLKIKNKIHKNSLLKKNSVILPHLTWIKNKPKSFTNKNLQKIRKKWKKRLKKLKKAWIKSKQKSNKSKNLQIILSKWKKKLKKVWTKSKEKNNKNKNHQIILRKWKNKLKKAWTKSNQKSNKSKNQR